MLTWFQVVFQGTGDQVIAIDSKRVRQSHDRANVQETIHVVSAWAIANHLVLGQQQVADKSNEFTATPELLRLLEIRDSIIIVDAIGCQTEIAEQLIDQGADYLLTVKRNQPHLVEDLAFFFKLPHRIEFRKIEHAYARTVNKGYCRAETRHCCVSSVEKNLQFRHDYGQWK